MGYGQQAGGTHPTGMHSCEICDGKENFEKFNLYILEILSTFIIIQEWILVKVGSI